MAGGFNNLPKLPDGKIDFARLYKPEEEIDIDQFFSKKELEEMSLLDKKRYKNLKMNYEVMLMMGLPALKPDFMKGPAYRARMASRQDRADYKVPSDTSDDSDEEWTPNMNRKKAKVTNPSTTVGLVGTKLNKATKELQAAKATRQAKHFVNQSLPTEEFPDPLPADQYTSTKKPKSARKPPAKRKRLDYDSENNPTVLGEKQEKVGPSMTAAESLNSETEEILKDNLPTACASQTTANYCEECNKEYERECPVHGDLVWIKDSETSLEDPDKASQSLPPYLVVKESGIRGAGLGVWSTEEFPARVVFGPYGGEIMHNEEKAHSSGYAWQIYKDRKPSHFVDARDKSKSNWMRYVNCAASEAEQNLVAFQYKGEIYYRSYKTIPPGTELLVWYGQEYARELGVIRDKNLLLVPKYVGGEEIYTCLYCKNAFGSALYHVKHLLRIHGCDKLEKENIQVLNKWLQEQTHTANGHPEQQSRQITSGKVPYGTCGKSKDILTEKKLNRTSNKSFAHVKHNIHNAYAKDCIGTENIQTRKICSKFKNCDTTFTGVDHKHSLIRKHIGNRPVTCGAYDKPFNERSNLLAHHILHTGDRPFNCDTCGKAFNQSGTLQMRLRIHTGDKPFKCDSCGKVFSRSGDLQTHLRIHTGDRPFKSDTCGKALSCSGDLQKHLRIPTGDRPFKCKTCGKAFSRSGHLQTHLRIHTGDRPFKCDTCGKAFSQSGHLQTHLRIHTGDRPFKCDTCGKAFSQSGDLQTHLRIHTGDRPFKCDTCGKAFSRSGDLQKHLRIHTGDRPFKCDTCGKAFSRSGNLQTHLRIHTGDRPFKCDTCGKAFSLSGNLQTHLRIHTGDRPFKCDTCGKAFSRSGDLQTHLRIHTGDRPFKCDTCGKAFSHSGDLQTHLRIHTGDRPFKCDTCGKAFSHSGDLQTHLRIHTGDRPFKCDTCGKAFSHSGDLQTHLRIHTGDRPFKCDTCGKAFSQSCHLQTHLRIHTGDRPI